MDGLQGFDPSTMNYLATQMAHPNVGLNGDPFQEMLLPLEAQDQQSAYGYAGSDDFPSLQPQTTPQLHRFSSTYEDPFSDVVSAFETQINNEPDPETPQIERDNKLLGFSPPVFDYALLDYTYRRTTISLTAQLHGMFFLAESPWANAADAQTTPTELTCYRRNLFQITGEITVPRTLRCIMTDAGEQVPIVGQELVISATESTEGNSVKIISVPWKTPANPTGPLSDDKTEREPPAIPLDPMSTQDLDSDFATFPFQWKRLQFRIATANNGRRKELQQHFVVRLKIMATLATGGQVPICEVHSGAIIVRGRSPRNFQSRKDMPLNGSGHVRKASLHPGQANRTTSGDSVKRAGADPTSTSVPARKPSDDPPLAPQVPLSSYFSLADANLTNDFFDWKTTPPNAHHNPGTTVLTALPPQSNGHENGAAAANIYATSSPDLGRASSNPFPPPPLPSAPINLSLVEDESPRQPDSITKTNKHGSTPPDQRAAKKLNHHALPPRAPSFSLNMINSPDESADLLYEYFPLGLDDWMPPVDAVYRPHVVHHTKLPSDPRDPKANGARGARSKRYFSESVT